MGGKFVDLGFEFDVLLDEFFLLVLLGEHFVDGVVRLLIIFFLLVFGLLFVELRIGLKFFVLLLDGVFSLFGTFVLLFDGNDVELTFRHPF